RSAHHGDLPPFPTRRSSDLAALVEYLELDGELSAVVVAAGRVRRFGLGAVDEVERRLGELRFGLRRLAYDLASPHSLTRLADRTDRKSTRLNSSHDQISYAV